MKTSKRTRYLRARIGNNIPCNMLSMYNELLKSMYDDGRGSMMEDLKNIKDKIPDNYL